MAFVVSRTELPSGTVTFLFTDIEGSTSMLQRLGSSYEPVLEAHRELLRVVFAESGGHEIATEGDSFFVAFSSAVGAVAAAMHAQLALRAQPWPAGGTVRVRIGIHTGDALPTGDNYTALAVHQAARVSGAAHGEQILVTQATRDLVADHPLDGATLVDLGEHMLKDLARPLRLFQVTHPDLPAEFPPIRSLSVRPNNLPAQLTSFIGRDTEVRDVGKLFDASRLVTLTGGGGVGKTRLALEVAEAALDSYADGVWLIELGAITDVDLVAPAAAAALRVREDSAGVGASLGGAEAARSFEASLLDALRHKHTLLLLDNCEHLIDAVAALVELILQRCPLVSILATSREPLGLRAESAWRVPSLSVPSEGAYAEELLSFPAVRLFTERAHNVHPDFVVDYADAPFVVDICRRLDGIPLALELAAARVDVLSVGQIAHRLDDRFRLLVGGSRTALERQQTLRATIDWSYDALSGPEQRLLDRLSVFVGGFGLNAAESVCGDGSDDVLELLSALVRKSLVVVEQQRGPARYHLLDTIRQYARDKLIERDEGSELRERHFGYFRELAERTGAFVVYQLEPADARLLDDVERELDNLRAALEWSRGRPEGLAMAVALATFGLARGHVSESAGWIEQGLERTPDLTESLRAEALVALSRLAFSSGDLERAATTAAEALALSREIGWQRGIVEALLWLGWCRWGANDASAARDLGEQSLEISREASDAVMIRSALYLLGRVEMLAPRLPEAQAYLEEDLALARSIGATSVYTTLHGLAWISVLRRQHDEAEMILDDAEARVLLGEAARLALAVGDLYWVSMTEGDMMGWLAYLSRDLDEAARCFDSAVVTARDHPRAVAFGTSWIAQLAIETATDAAAFDALEDRLVASRDVAHVWTATVVKGTRALLEGRVGDGERLAAEAIAEAPVGYLAGMWFGVQMLVATYLRGSAGSLVDALRAEADRFPNEIGYRAALAIGYVEAGRLDDAASEFDTFARQGFPTGALPMPRFQTLAFLADVCAALEAADHAPLLYARLRPFEGRLVAIGPAACYGSVSRHLGRLATVIGRWDDAARHFDDALHRNRRIGAGPFVAFTQRDYARMLSKRGRAGDAERAAVLLTEALTTADRLEMRGLERECQAAMKMLDGG